MGRKTTGGKEKLEFSGKLTYSNAPALRLNLADALEKKSLEISFGKVEEVDLSFLQLLCSALRTASDTSREVTVADGPVPASVSELVDAAGMVSPLGRRDDGFWSLLTGKVGVRG